MTNHQMNVRWRWLLALLALLALVAASCGDDDDSGAESDDDVETSDDADTDAEDEADDTDDDTDDAEGDDADSDDTDDAEGDDAPTGESGPGVTDTTITIGVSYLDFEFLRENFQVAGWGDQLGVWEALIADLNSRGGINGREVVAVYDAYSATDPVDANAGCVRLTEDQEVFAVLGGFVGPVSTENPCIVDLNETMLIGGRIVNDQLESARAPWYDVGGSISRETEVLLDLLLETGRADGASVFVLSHQSAQDRAAEVEQALADRGIERVDSAVLDADDGDQAAQDQIMAAISEAIRVSGADTVMINGNPSAPLRGLIAAGLMDELAVWSNQLDGLSNLGPSVDRTQAEGVLVAMSATDSEQYADPEYQACQDVVLAAIPDAEIIDPAEIADDEENWFNGIRRYCRLLSLFEQVGTEAGEALNYETFVAAANGPAFDDFSLPGSPRNSLGPDKTDAQDEYRLGEYSATESDGAPAPIGELVDIFE